MCLFFFRVTLLAPAARGCSPQNPKTRENPLEHPRSSSGILALRFLFQAAMSGEPPTQWPIRRAPESSAADEESAGLETHLMTTQGTVSPMPARPRGDAQRGKQGTPGTQGPGTVATQGTLTSKHTHTHAQAKPQNQSNTHTPRTQVATSRGGETQKRNTGNAKTNQGGRNSGTQAPTPTPTPQWSL